MSKSKNTIKIAWYGKHFGEEPPLTGKSSQGAGGIFFSGCHLHCVFCQNYQISQDKLGKDYSVAELVKIMLDLQKQGAINIDLVTPTIWSSQIIEAVKKAREQGLKLPIIWNSNGYESTAMIKSLKGIVDIYLPDFKYGIEEIGFKYSGIKKYPEIAEKAIREMIKQAGRKNVIVRHLVIPNNLENSFKALEILADIDNKINISLMSQYYPLYQAKNHPEINRPVTADEWQKINDHLENLGFENGWVQDLDSSDVFIPDFTKKEPFKS